MKKMILVALLVLLPMSVYALEPMSMDALGDITAQEGVEISFSGTGSGGEFLVTQQAANTGWSNTNATNECGIAMVVSEGSTQTILVSDSLTIQATDDGVVIDVPTLSITRNPSKTDIYIGKRAKITDTSDDDYLKFIENIAVVGNKLGSQYTSGGATSISTGNKITISAM